MDLMKNWKMVMQDKYKSSVQFNSVAQSCPRTRLKCNKNILKREIACNNI